MKRFRLWLLLFPVLLCALAWGLKWRADHPTPTKLDLEARSLMLESPNTSFSCYPHTRDQKRLRAYWVMLSQKELAPFVDSFNISSQKNRTVGISQGKSGTMHIECFLSKPRKDGVAGVVVNMSVDERRGKVVILHRDNKEELDLHPATIKRWINLLLAHPKIGPELRRRMK